MSTPTLEKQIMDLQERIRAENKRVPQTPENIPNRTLPLAVERPNRPNRLGDVNTSHRPRPNDLKVARIPPQTTPDDKKWQVIVQKSGLLKIKGQEYRTQINDLEHLGELGNGTCGHVVKMLHKPSQAIIAVKQMRRSGNHDENKRITMDIEVVLESDDCPYIVQCLGCFILEADVWICMELMATCFDKLLKELRKIGQRVPENILGKVTVATVKALNYLKEKHGVIHRDVKPSNILLDERGNVKLCDFGISGRLVDSKAQTRSAGCAAYMAPERIDPPDPSRPDYDIRADVWSLGITLVELATGVFPYSNCQNDFEVLTMVLTDNPPRLPENQSFSDEFRDFVTRCLTKDYRKRPKYKGLLEHAFIVQYEHADVNVAEWYASVIQSSTPLSVSRPSATATVPNIGVLNVNSTASSNSSVAANFNDVPTEIATVVRSTPTPPPPLSVRQNSVQRERKYHHQVGMYQTLPSQNSTTSHSIQYESTPQNQSSYTNGEANGRFLPSQAVNSSTSLSQSEVSSGGRFSAFHSSRIPTPEVNSMRSTPPPISRLPAQAFWKNQENRAADWETNRPGFNSPVLGRKRYPSEPPPHIHRDHYNNAAPFPVQRYVHQQQYLPSNNLPHHHVNSYVQTQVPGRLIPTEPVENIKPEESGEKLFKSYRIFSLGKNSSGNGGSTSGRLPPPRPARRSSPGPAAPSPDPPPRINRMSSTEGTPVASPMIGRRNYVDISPVRRGVLEGSPSLPRRYVSPSPPQPPPRRLSTDVVPLSGSRGLSPTGTSSVPGSPQVRRVETIQAHIHYTPQPQRRVFRRTDFSEL